MFAGPRLLDVLGTRDGEKIPLLRPRRERKWEDRIKKYLVKHKRKKGRKKISARIQHDNQNSVGGKV